MYSKILRVAAALASITVIMAEPPSNSYGPPGYSAPAVISSSGPLRNTITNSGSSSPSIIRTSSPSIIRTQPSTIIRAQSPTIIRTSAPSNTNVNVGPSSSVGSSSPGFVRNNDFGNSGRYNGNNGEGGQPEPFNYAYEVKDGNSGNDFSSQANSDGKRVEGEYRVLLPDGRRQIVKYVADDGGYNADVQYEGQARFPAPTPYNGPLAVPNGGNSGSIITGPGNTIISSSPVLNRGPTTSPIIVRGPTSTPIIVRDPSSNPIIVGPTSGPSRSSSFSGYRY